jgi:hypothetical protein
MVVTLLYRGLRITGIHVGRENALRHFTSGSTSVELQMDHLAILCSLGPRFWEDRPEIQDPRLCLWLESKFHQRGTGVSAPHLALVPSGPNSFRITSLALTPPPALSKSQPQRATA